MRIARSSASLRLAVPFCKSFSLGLSSSAQSVIFSDMQLNIYSTCKLRKSCKIKKGF
jgi:hypothetical protein